MSGGWPFRLPAGWEAVRTGGYFSHLVHLRHGVCGRQSFMPFDLAEGTQAREYVYGHEAGCGEQG